MTIKLDLNKFYEEDIFVRSTGMKSTAYLSLLVTELYKKFIIISCNSTLWAYTDGYYKEFEKEIFKKMIMKLFGKTAMAYNDRKGNDAHAQMITLSSVENITYSFNNYPHLIPFKNGYYNLKTNEFEVCRQDVYFTNHLPFDFNPEPQCPLFQRTIEEIIPDDEDRLYFLTYIRYCFGSSIERQIALILYGQTGDNGKTTLIEFFVSMLGDLSTKFSFSALSKGSGSITEINGAFMALASEIGRTERLDISSQERIKEMITDKELAGRGAYQKHQKWVNTTKFIFTTNRFPDLGDPDRAFFRRFKIIEFLQTFTGKNKDYTRFDRIKATESGDVLSWILLHYQDLSILTTDWEEVRDFWLTKSNIIKQFFTECCYYETPVPTTDNTTAVYIKYVEWCTLNNKKSKTQDTFKDNMKRLGCVTTQIRNTGTWVYEGVRVR